MIIDAIMLRKFKKICEYKNDGLLQNKNLILCILRNRHQTCKSKNKFSDCESNGNTVFVLQDQPHWSNFGGELVIQNYVIFWGLTSSNFFGINCLREQDQPHSSNFLGPLLSNE